MGDPVICTNHPSHPSLAKVVEVIIATLRPRWRRTASTRSFSGRAAATSKIASAAASRVLAPGEPPHPKADAFRRLAHRPSCGDRHRSGLRPRPKNQTRRNPRSVIFAPGVSAGTHPVPGCRAVCSSLRIRSRAGGSRPGCVPGAQHSVRKDLPGARTSFPATWREVSSERAKRERIPPGDKALFASQTYVEARKRRLRRIERTATAELKAAFSQGILSLRAYRPALQALARSAAKGARARSSQGTGAKSGGCSYQRGISTEPATG